jgi:hypothetical protein
LHFRNALFQYLSSSFVSLPIQIANRSALGLIVAVVGLTAGLQGCGAPNYASMSRAAAGQVALEDASSPIPPMENGQPQTARLVAANEPISIMRGEHDAIRSNPDSRPAQDSLSSADAALAVKPVSSLKMRKQVQLQSLTCANQTMTGAGTTACTVTLSAGAPNGGSAVALSSNNAAVTVPPSVTVQSGASAASFSATIAAVGTGQTASVNASANGATRSFGIQLNASTPSLALSSTTVSFGGVNVGQTATSTVTLSSSGNAPLTISSISVAGSLFKATGVTAPLTLNPGQTAALTLQFLADHVSSFSGIVTISSNSTQGSSTISMSGDGVAPALSGLTCKDATVVGAEANACSVSLSAAAPSGGVTIALSSNNAAVSLPSSIIIPAGALSANFSAAITAVSSAQTVSITGTANGSTKSFAIQLNVGNPSFSLSSTSVPFGSVVVGQTATKTVTLTSSGNAPLIISSISVAGSLFKATGLTTPLTLNPGQSATLTLQFYSDHTSSFTGVVTISSNSTQGAATINMSGDGVPSVSGLTCNTQSYTGAGTDSCLVSLYGTAPDTGFTVSLSSSNSSVTVPASVCVPAGAMSTSFSATVKSVSTSQTATLTATAGGIAKSFTVQLGTSSGQLSANASSIPFGSVLINSPAEQSITLTSSGTSPVTISSIATTGAGFTGSGLAVPITLNPGQTAVLNVQFTPTATGNFAGQMTIVSNSSSGNITIGLNGSGYGHKVQLNWNAPSSSAVAGYNVYRVASGSTSYQRVNSSALSSTTFTDGNVQSGSSYTYYVTSLDGSGLESVPSNTTMVVIPTP